VRCFTLASRPATAEELSQRGGGLWLGSDSVGCGGARLPRESICFAGGDGWAWGGVGEGERQWGPPV